MINLCMDPEGKTVLKPFSASDTHRASTALSTATATVTDPSDEVAALKQQILELGKNLQR